MRTTDNRKPGRLRQLGRVAARTAAAAVLIGAGSLTQTASASAETAADDGYWFVGKSHCIEQLTNGTYYLFISVCQGQNNTENYTTIYDVANEANETWCIPKDGPGLKAKVSETSWEPNHSKPDGCETDGDRDGEVRPYILWIVYPD